jgi:arsenate reductase
MIKIYGIKNCDTMKKAFTWLDKHKIKYEFHDYKQLSIDEEKLQHWMKTIPVDQLMNLKSATWRTLSENDKKSLSNQKKAIAIMIKNTSVIKRPLVELGKDKYLLGFNAEEWEKKF